MDESHPLITIVTVCYNSQETIGRTIESVLKQDLSRCEYLVIDGASKDRTLDIIEQYRSQFGDKLRVISEQDNGWYDAMNKGIKNAKGEFIQFLNSDDYFAEGAIESVVDFISDNHITSNSVVYGDSTNVYKNSKGMILYRYIEAPDNLDIQDKSLRDGMCGIRHQSMFTGKAVFDKVGLLNLKYRLHADWDFLIKCITANIKMYHINRNLIYYSMYGVSTNPNYDERHILRAENHLVKGIDWYYLKDRWGIRVISKKVLGSKCWNDLLFWIHTKKHIIY